MAKNVLPRPLYYTGPVTQIFFNSFINVHLFVFFTFIIVTTVEISFSLVVTYTPLKIKKSLRLV